MFIMPCANEVSCICSLQLQTVFSYTIPRNCRRRSCMGPRVAMRAGHHICSNILVATARLISSRSFVEKVPSRCLNASSGNSYTQFTCTKYDNSPLTALSTPYTDRCFMQEELESADPQKRDVPTRTEGLKAVMAHMLAL